MQPSVGRPRAAESRRRSHEFVRLIIDGCSFALAAREAHIKPVRALALLDELQGLHVIEFARRPPDEAAA